MVPLGLSMNRVAVDSRVLVTRIVDMVNEKRAITADTALRFARYFNNSPAFWMNLQTRYELEVAEDEIADKVERDDVRGNDLCRGGLSLQPQCPLNILKMQAN
jgi:addiction module HigA family antidote